MCPDPAQPSDGALNAEARYVGVAFDSGTWKAPATEARRCPKVPSANALKSGPFSLLCLLD